MFMPVRNFVNMYIHVCTMYRDVCTDLPILVQVIRIPDEVRTRYVLFTPSLSTYQLHTSQISMYSESVRTEYRKHDKSTYSRLKVQTFCVSYQYVPVRTKYIFFFLFLYRLFYISKHLEPLFSVYAWNMPGIYHVYVDLNDIHGYTWYILGYTWYIIGCIYMVYTWYINVYPWIFLAF
jgi:hypothetical protein